MTCKLHINLTQGLIDVEGSEQFVLAVYQDFKNKISGNITADQKVSTTPINKNDNEDIKNQNPISKAKAKNPVKKKSSSQGYIFNKGLNLYKEGDKQSLEDFLKGYKTSSNFERNLVFIHYLKTIKETKVVSLNDVYTCYKALGLKIPNVKQSLYDTSHNKQWLDTSSIDNIEITVAGDNAVSHELLIANSD